MGRYFTATVGVSLFCLLFIVVYKLYHTSVELLLIYFRIATYLFPNSTLSIFGLLLIYFQIVPYLFSNSTLSISE